MNILNRLKQRLQNPKDSASLMKKKMPVKQNIDREEVLSKTPKESSVSTLTIPVIQKQDSFLAKAKNIAQRTVNRTSVSSELKRYSGPFQKDIIRRPLVTEKATTLGHVMFEVAPHATKPQITDTIFALYGIVPTSVRIMNMRGRRVRWNNRKGQRKDWKKAIVTLPKGTSLNVYEGT